MKMRLFPLAFVLLIAIAWSGCTTLPVTSGAAPDFTLESLDGDAVTLSDLKGQVVVIDFWTTWCGPCVEALDHLQQIHEQYADQGVVVLAIDIEETREEIAPFVADRGYTMTVLLDGDSRVSERYGVQGIPHTLVVDREEELHYARGGARDVEEILGELVAE
jgi:thiol-disulfide isomerase/thioredoxin